MKYYVVFVDEEDITIIPHLDFNVDELSSTPVEKTSVAFLVAEDDDGNFKVMYVHNLSKGNIVTRSTDGEISDEVTNKIVDCVGQFLSNFYPPSESQT